MNDLMKLPDPFQRAVGALCLDIGEFRGTGYALLVSINGLIALEGKDPFKFPAGWPTNAHEADDRIRAGAEGLKALGFSVEMETQPPRPGSTRAMRWWMISPPALPASPPPAARVALCSESP